MIATSEGLRVSACTRGSATGSRKGSGGHRRTSVHHYDWAAASSCGSATSSCWSKATTTGTGSGQRRPGTDQSHTWSWALAPVHTADHYWAQTAVRSPGSRLVVPGTGHRLESRARTEDHTETDTAIPRQGAARSGTRRHHSPDARHRQRATGYRRPEDASLSSEGPASRATLPVTEDK